MPHAHQAAVPSFANPIEDYTARVYFSRTSDHVILFTFESRMKNAASDQCRFDLGVAQSPRQGSVLARTSVELMMKGEQVMPRGDKGSYTDKQKRKAEHIEEGYEKKGVSKKEAESRAWATVNKESGGGKKRGSGRGKKGNKKSSKKGGKKGGKKKKS